MKLNPKTYHGCHVAVVLTNRYFTPAAEILRVMPTDDDVDGLFAAASSSSKREDGAPEEYGTGIVWEEFHMPTNYKQ